MPTAPLCLMAACLAFQGPGAGAAGWSRVTADDGSSTAEMPAPPQVSKQRVTGPKEPTTMTVSYCRVNGALFTLQSLPSATPVPEDGAAALDREKKSYVSRNRGKLVKEGKATVGGRPAIDFTVEGPAPGGPGLVTSRVRIVLDGSSYHVLTVMSARDKPLPGETARFIESLALAPARAGASDPESALRAFLLAVTFNDEAALRQLVLPTDDFAVLLKGEVPPAEQAERVRAMFRTVPIRVYKPGETIEIALREGKSVITIQPEEANAENAVLMPQGAPVPTRLQKVEGRWRVDATPIIAARKAAQAVRKTPTKK